MRTVTHPFETTPAPRNQRALRLLAKARHRQLTAAIGGDLSRSARHALRAQKLRALIGDPSACELCECVGAGI